MYEGLELGIDLKEEKPTEKTTDYDKGQEKNNEGAKEGKINHESGKVVKDEDGPSYGGDKIDITKDDMRTTFHQKSYVKFNYTNFNMFKTTTSGTVYFSDNAKNLQDGSRRLAIPHLVLIGSTAYQYTSIASPTQAQLTAVNSLKQSYDALVIANGYVNVGNSAFKGFQFKTISLPSSLKTIGNDAFAGNKCLSIEVPSSVTQINDRAFSSETLETIILRCNADALSSNALAGCSRLKTILIYDYTGDKSQITPQKFGLGDDVAIIFA